MDRPWGRVPSWVGEALRAELADATDEIIGAVRAEVPEYARPLTGRFGMRITEGVSVALGQFVELIGRDEGLEDVRVYRALGQLEHREGRTLAALQLAYQVGTRTMWRRLGRGPDGQHAARGGDLQPGRGPVHLRRADLRGVGGGLGRRGGQPGRLDAGPPARAGRAAGPATGGAGRPRWSGWPPRPAGRCRPGWPRWWWRTRWRWRRGCPERSGPTWTRSGVVLLPAPDRSSWLDRVRAGLGGRRAVVGPAVDAAQAHRSVARAQAAWPLHVAGLLRAGSADSLARADEHLLALLLAAEPELAADLRERATAPLRALPAGAAARGEQTLRAWLDAHGDVAVAAAALHVHPQTVRYRLAGLREAVRRRPGRPGRPPRAGHRPRASTRP